MRRNRLSLEYLEDRICPSSTNFVNALYTEFLNRAPASSELTAYVNQLSGGASNLSIASGFANSAEFQQLETIHDYQTLLGRTPSTSEVQFWQTQRQAGVTFQQETAAFLASDEFFLKSGGTSQGWLNAVYKDVLNRATDPGASGWLAQDLSTAASRLTVAQAIVTSPEALNNVVSQAYTQFLNRPVDSGALTYWAGQLAQGLPVEQLDAVLASSPEFLALAPTVTLPGGTTGNPTTNPSSNPTGSPTAVSPANASTLITLTLPPLDINLLGLEIKTPSTITVTVSAAPGQGELLGNLLTTVSGLVNLQGVNSALNNVLGNVVTLLNSASLSVNGLGSLTGSLSTAAVATTPVLDLFVAPVHLNLLGALVDTSPIHLQILAHSGPGLILGNVVTDLANLFNPPLPNSLNLDTINTQLQNLLSELNAQIPGITSAPVTPVTINGNGQVLSLSVPPLNVNLLGLVLKTSQIQVNANAITGNGDLLGNVVQTLLNTLGATPQQLTSLSNNLNSILAKVIGVLNASNLTLPAGAVSSLSQVLQTLSLPNLITTSTSNASTPILNLAIASTDGSTPPVNVNLLGLQVTTSNIQAQLLAQTGDGQILGNLLYNVANLLNPGGALNLLTILGELAL